MCECGCGQLNIRQAFRIGNQILAIDDYRGCEYCSAGPGVSLRLFCLKGWKEWGDNMPVVEIKGDEYGGNEGMGWPVSFCDHEKLIASVKTLGLNPDDEEIVTETIRDFWLKLLRACTKFPVQS